MKTRRTAIAGLVLLAAAPVAAQAPEFADRVGASLTAFAIGDAMGAPVEGWKAEKIAEEYEAADLEIFLGPTHGGDPSQGKGHGRITDDTLLMEAIMRAYAAHGDHMDAYDYAELFVPEIGEVEVWVPERQEMRLTIDRPVWWPERYAYQRNAIHNAEPRTAGVGNWPNQGYASVVMPIGAVNAADPRGAYDEAVAFGSAHTYTYALEAAAVTAAGYAAAFAHGATVADVVEVARTIGRDGTRQAMEAVVAIVDPDDDVFTFAAKARAAWLPFSGLPAQRLADGVPDTGTMAGTDIAQPSRTDAIENIPVAFAALLWGGGDWDRTMAASIFYGEDCESIAAVALSLLAAVEGPAVVPDNLVAAANEVNRRDFPAAGRAFALVAEKIVIHDAERLAARRAAVAKEE